MTVQELISKLEELPKDKKVYFSDNNKVISKEIKDVNLGNARLTEDNENNEAQYLRAILLG